MASLVCDNVEPEVVNKACDAFVSQVEKLKAARGGHFEKFKQWNVSQFVHNFLNKHRFCGRKVLKNNCFWGGLKPLKNVKFRNPNFLLFFVNQLVHGEKIVLFPVLLVQLDPLAERKRLPYYLPEKEKSTNIFFIKKSSQKNRGPPCILIID